MNATLRPEPDVAASAPPAEPSGDLIWRIGLVALLVATAALMLYLSRGLTFNLDEWTVVTERRGAGAPSLLAPHNEHLSILVLGLLVGLLDIGGLDAQPLLMVPLIALQITLGVLLFVIARRRVGAGVALGVAAVAMLSGLAYENFLVPGQAGQMASIVAGVAVFALLDLPRTPRNDRLLAALMIIAIASSGMGIPVLVGVAVELLLTREGRERLWVVGMPFALYLLWYVAYGTNRAVFDELALSLLWAWTALGHAAGAMIGERQIEPGRQFLVVLLVILAYRTWRIQPPARIRMLALASVLATFYGLTAISRHDIAPPSSSRYLTVGLVFMLLMLVEAARGWRIRRWVPAVVLLLVLISFSKDSALAFREGRTVFLERSNRVRASLGAVELLGRERVDPKLEIAPLAAPFLEAGGWFGARADLRGNPADSPRELVAAPADARSFADDTLVRAGGLALRPPGPAPKTCRPAWTGDRGAVPAAGVRIEAGATRPLLLRARRLGTQWIAVGVLPIPPGRAVELHPLGDALPRPYELRAQGAARACSLGG